VFAFPDVMDLFPHELPGLRAGGLSLPLVAACSVERSFLGHDDFSCSPALPLQRS
jgi:hypothetical protein